MAKKPLPEINKQNKANKIQKKKKTCLKEIKKESNNKRFSRKYYIIIFKFMLI